MQEQFEDLSDVHPTQPWFVETHLPKSMNDIMSKAFENPI